MTITKLTYRCDRESLGGVDKSAFVDALENELMAIHQFREASVEVEFGTRKSGLHSVRGFDLSDDPVAELSDLVREAAERAWSVCLSEA